jgi:hypothetical protein
MPQFGTNLWIRHFGNFFPNISGSPGYYPGLSDGVFSNQKSKFGYILWGLGLKKVGMFYGHLSCSLAIWYILRLFGNSVAIWYIFPCFGIINNEKSGNPGPTNTALMRFLRLPATN